MNSNPATEYPMRSLAFLALTSALNDLNLWLGLLTVYLYWTSYLHHVVFVWKIISHSSTRLRLYDTVLRLQYPSPVGVMRCMYENQYGSGRPVMVFTLSCRLTRPVWILVSPRRHLMADACSILIERLCMKAGEETETDASNSESSIRSTCNFERKVWKRCTLFYSRRYAADMYVFSGLLSPTITLKSVRQISTRNDFVYRYLIHWECLSTLCTIVSLRLTTTPFGHYTRTLSDSETSIPVLTDPDTHSTSNHDTYLPCPSNYLCKSDDRGKKNHGANPTRFTWPSTARKGPEGRRDYPCISLS